MTKSKKVFTVLLLAAWSVQMAPARVARDAAPQRVNTQNRSTGVNVNQNRSANQNVNANRNTNINNNTNVNRNTNINNNNNVNVNVDRDVNVYGRGYGGAVVVEDNDWNWGAFAVGATAAAVTTAAVASAASSGTTVVTAPAIGTTVAVLPGGCSSMAAGSDVIYQCGGAYYRPFYQGTTLVYQITTYP